MLEQDTNSSTPWTRHQEFMTKCYSTNLVVFFHSNFILSSLFLRPLFIWRFVHRCQSSPLFAGCQTKHSGMTAAFYLYKLLTIQTESFHFHFSSEIIRMIALILLLSVHKHCCLICRYLAKYFDTDQLAVCLCSRQICPSSVLGNLPATRSMLTVASLDGLHPYRYRLPSTEYSEHSNKPTTGIGINSRHCVAV